MLVKNLTKQTHQLVGRIGFIPRYLKERNFLAYFMTEAEIVKIFNKPDILKKSTVSVLSVGRWANKAFEGRRNVAGIQKQLEILFQDLVQTQRGFP